MDTQLIYVSKDTADVKNEKTGEFINAVSDGIVVRTGDEISIEGIAVNSLSVGSEIIEIPQTIKGFEYKTNSMKMNMLMYIHHNYEFTCSLPFSTPTLTWYSNPSQSNYGYLTTDSFNGINQFYNLSTTRTNLKADLLNGGKRYYLGCFTSGNDVHNPSRYTSTGVSNLTPNYAYWRLVDTNIEFDVDIGYDSPENIGNKISTDFKSGIPAPQYPNISEQEPVNYHVEGIAFETGDSFQQNIKNLGVTGKDTAVITINGTPRSFYNSGTSNISIYQNYMGVLNPHYYYYGSRLLSSLNGKNNNYSQYLRDQGIFIKSGNTYNITAQNSLPMNNSGNTQYSDGFTVVTNLKFDQRNLDLVAPFIHSLKRYFGTKGTTESLRTTDKDLWKYNFIWGRVSPIAGVNDGTGIVSPYITAGTECETAQEHFAQAFFNERIYNKQYIQDSPQLKLRPDYIIQYDNVDYSAKSIAKKLDIMVTAVQTGIGTGRAEQYNIGFIMNNTTIIGESYLRGNQVLVDFAFAREEANAVMVINPHLRKGGDVTVRQDYLGSTSVGAPDMNLFFDSTRGRFAFNNMSWSAYVGSSDATTAFPAAAAQVITSNAQNKTDPELFSYLDNGINQRNAFTKYAQTGLSINSLSVIKLDGTAEEIYDNKYDIETKYKNSLLDRLGFSFQQLTDSYGQADAIFTQKTYQSKIPIELPFMFPSPFTTNARFDSTINQSLSSNDSNLPLFDLQNSRNILNVNIAATSDNAYAVKAPNKLAFAYWLIQSDIIDGVKFTSNEGQPNPVLAVCSRSYISGNFAYSFQSTNAVVATHDFVLTGIKTRVLNPDYSPATVDSKTSIIYKIQGPNRQLEANKIAEEMAKEEREN